jgi:uncharacterized metal-binding protein YceD (DUF177 family)
MSQPPFSETVRLNQIGSGLTRTLHADEAERRRIAADLDLAELTAFSADVELAPTDAGWRLNGRVRASAVQTCGITLEPLPVEIDTRFAVALVETAEAAPDEIVIDLEDDDAPDVIEDGRIDLGQYAVEQLSLSLDPFPRKPRVEFEQPEQPAETSPFAALKAFKPRDSSGEG